MPAAFMSVWTDWRTVAVKAKPEIAKERMRLDAKNLFIDGLLEDVRGRETRISTAICAQDIGLKSTGCPGGCQGRRGERTSAPAAESGIIAP